jgi:sulfite reductase alpha subunit-like flavoprotein
MADLMFLQGSGIEFQPGDTVGVIPQNSKDEVQKIMKRLKILDRAETVVTVSVKPGAVERKAHVPPHIPTKATLRHILQTCLDIRAVPKKVTAPYAERECVCVCVFSGLFSELRRESDQSTLGILAMGSFESADCADSHYPHL